MEDNQTDRWFRHQLEEAEMKPPSASWAQMEAILDAQNSDNQNKKRPFAWYWAAAALIPLALVFWFMNKNTNPEKAGLIVENQVSERSDKPAIPSEKTGTPTAQKYEPQQQPAEQERQVAMQAPTKQARPAEEKLSEQQSAILLPLAEVRDSKSAGENETPVQPALTQSFNPNEEEEWVSIEFRPAKPEPNEPEPHQLAIVEWRPGKPEKPNLPERLAKLKKAGIQNLPSVDKAKSDLLAFLGFNK